MGRLTAFVVALAVLWFLWSGHQDVFVLSMGGLSVLSVVYLSKRMGLIDHEGFPIEWFFRAPRYWIWLWGEIIKSNFYVCRRVVSPVLHIDPVETTVSCSQNTDLGRVTYANSITLTPGTVSTGVEGELIHIHALTSAAAEALKTDFMDKQVSKLEQGR
ncbi:MAG: multicomponent Na+:H+ antiporter subunit E [Parasphingorhabdus sp.]|jgi:multicomponent Na+:H+ antiporter subunit E